MYSLLKKITPAFIKKCFRVFFNNYLKNTKQSASRNFHCPVCQNSVESFLRLDELYLQKFDKHGFIHSIFLFETLNIFNYSCPFCGAADRDRLYALFLKKKLNKINQLKTYKFIDFAPAPALSNLIRSYSFLNYRSADLFMKGVDDIADLTDLNIYDDSTIDFFICSHILEHIQDDIKAISELYRILKDGGWGILMVPILLNLKEIYENPEIVSEEERWKHFGQNDHVRIYSKQGFINRVKSVGFKIEEFGENYFGKEVFDKSGIQNRSVLYIVSK
ncbi:MAG: methyltransferase domain-containing protein [Bacteroidales bacterium]